MSKPSWFFWVVTIVAVLWGAYGVFDFVMTYTGNEAYLQAYPPEMIAWIQGFPTWRLLLWGLGVLTYLVGPLLMAMRKAAAVPVLLVGVAALLIGFIGHDILMANGVEMYGQAGMIASIVIVIISIFIAWYARRAKQKGYLA